MLWHGIRAPAVAGVGRQPVSIGTLPTRVPAAQPGPPWRRCTAACTRLSGWPRRPCSPSCAGCGTARRRTARALARPAGCWPTASTCCPALARLRAEVGAEQAGPGLGARPAARPGPAGVRRRRRPCCSSPPTPSSRPGGPALAARRAARLLAGGRDVGRRPGLRRGHRHGRAGPRGRRAWSPSTATRSPASSPPPTPPRSGSPTGSRWSTPTSSTWWPAGEAGARVRRPRPRPGAAGGRTAAARPRPLVAARGRR